MGADALLKGEKTIKNGFRLGVGRGGCDRPAFNLGSARAGN